MRRLSVLSVWLMAAVFIVEPRPASAQTAPQPNPDESRWTFDASIGIDPSINGNVNSGAIGVLQGQATAILPQSYGAVYGSGIQLRFGGGYRMRSDSELRGVFIYQSADADLVRLGDLGPSSLYAQYSDYKAFALDLGYRRYVPVSSVRGMRAFGEATIGLGFISSINVQLAAPNSNAIFNDTDFYDRTAAFTFGLSGGLLFPLSNRVDFTAQMGLRHVSGLSEVDQFGSTGLDEINNDSGRLTFPVIIGVRVHFR